MISGGGVRRTLFFSVFVAGCPGEDPGGGGETGTSTGAEVETGTSTGPHDEWDEVFGSIAGTRLHPLVRVAEDGTRAQVGWFDMMLEIECEFRQATDGVLRCLPMKTTTEPSRYADAECTEVVASELDLPDRGTVTVVREGCFGDTYWEIGEVVTTEIYANENGPCEVFSNDPGFHRLVAFPVDGFVSASVMQADGNDRIVPLVLRAEDGARQIVAGFDRDLEQEVTADVDVAGMTRWFGRWEPRVSTTYFGDAACIQTVAIGECIPFAAQPGSAVEREGCGPALGRRHVFAETNAVWRRNGSGACEPAMLATTDRVWRVGNPIPDTDFAEAPATNDGGMRLRHEVYATPEGEPLLSSMRFFDLLLDEHECDWVDDPNGGNVACRPKGAASLTSNYVDAACTQRVASRDAAELDCPGAAPAYGFLVGLLTEIVEPIASPGAYVRNADGDCVEEADTGVDTSQPDYYLAGEPLDVEPVLGMDVVE